MQPGEKGTLISEEDFRFDADGEGDAFPYFTGQFEGSGEGVAKNGREGKKKKRVLMLAYRVRLGGEVGWTYWMIKVVLQ